MLHDFLFLVLHQILVQLSIDRDLVLERIDLKR